MCTTKPGPPQPIFLRKMCATRHHDLLIRLTVLFARLQIRESTLGPFKTMNHRVTDPTKHTIVLSCLFLIMSKLRLNFCPTALFGLFEAITLSLLWTQVTQRTMLPLTSSEQRSMHKSGNSRCPEKQFLNTLVFERCGCSQICVSDVDQAFFQHDAALKIVCGATASAKDLSKMEKERCRLQSTV